MKSLRLALAGLVYLCAACGSVPQMMGDGGPELDGGSTPDAGAEPDAPPPPPGEATVIVVVEGRRRGGVPVVFHTPSGDVADVQYTDANGRATATVEAGAMATAVVDQTVDPMWTDASLVTVFLNPGEVVQVGSMRPGDAAYYVGTVQVIVPPANDPSVSWYSIEAGAHCPTFSIDPSAAGTSYFIDLYEACVQAGTNRFTLIARGFDAYGDTVRWTSLSGTLTPGGPMMTYTFPPWRTDLAATSFNMVNAPPGANSVNADVGLVLSSILFNGDGDQQPIAPGGSASPRPSYLPLAADGYLVSQFLLYLLPDGTFGGAVDFGVRPALGNTETLDLGTMLPPVTGLTWVRQNARPQIGWNDGAFHALGADTVLIRFGWTDAAGGASYRWGAVAPAGITPPFTFPALPPELASYRPPLANPLYRDPNVIFIDLDAAGSYAEAREFTSTIFFDGDPPLDAGHGRAAIAGLN